MGDYSANPSALVHKLLQWRWWIIACLSSVTLILEVLEHQPRNFQALGSGFLWEVFLYNLVLPLIFGAWLSLIYTNTSISQTVLRLDQQQEMRKQFIQARNWDELSSKLLDAPSAILPISGASLTLLEETTGKEELTKQWSEDGWMLPKFSPSPEALACLLGQSDRRLSKEGLSLCTCVPKEEINIDRQAYCIPLAYSGQLLGWMYVWTRPKTAFQKDQIKMMDSLGFEMCLAIETLRLRSWYESHSKTIEAERQHLAHYLHDTIAHDLAYLHLKLDQYSNGISLPDPAALQDEFGSLSEIAYRSYDQVRSTLSELQERTPTSLLAGIRDCTETTASRAHLKVDLNVSGMERSFPHHKARQILLIVREALRNVEKHANAKHAAVHLDWKEDGLEIQVYDDGQGFESAQMERVDNGFGLRFMEQAAGDLNGRSTVSSTKDHGTRLNFYFPLE